MDKPRALIIDDESLAREIIKKYIKDNGKLELLGECSNGFDGLKKINDDRPDIIFLDIQMPKINGFELLELLDDPPVVVFTTAFDQYALRAFEVNAVDYLLKPFSSERFGEAVEKAMVYLKKKSSQKEKIKGLIEHQENSVEFLNRIIIKEGSKISIVPVEDIKWFEAQDDYVMIYSAEGKFLKEKTMKYFEQHLDPKQFVRIHRSYIVALNRVKKIELLEKESYQVSLEDKTVLPMSKSGYDRLKKII